MKSDNRWIWITIGSMIVVFAAFSVLLWQIGLFNFNGTDASAKIVGSSIVLIGGFIGSLVTVVGIFLKHSMDQRNADLRQQAEERLRIESEKNNNLRDEAEKRLKLEAAIQAVKLLSSSSGKEVPISQRAGVLFTLASLGLPELALKMLRQLISSDRIDPCTASWVIDQAFESGKMSLQEAAVMILLDYPEKFLVNRGKCEFPRSILLDWNTELPKIVRQEAAKARLKLIAARPYSDWNDGVLNTHVVGLNSIWETEPDPKIKNGVGLCLEKIIRVYRKGEVLWPQSGAIRIDDLRASLLELVKNTHVNTTFTFFQLSDTFEQWSKIKSSKS